MRLPLKLPCALVFAGLFAGGAFAAEIENPPVFEAAKIPGVRPAGVNYSIVNPVRSDGFLRIYLLKTPYGDVPVTSDAMLHARLRELAAIDQLDKVSQSDAFNRALGEAGLAPVKYAGQMIINPIQTLGNTLAGIGNSMSQAGSGMANAGKTQDQAFGGLGADQKRRELAARLGVDPYTDFAPLAERLAKLSQAAAAGGLVVSGALMAIPGGVGVVVSNVSTGGRVSEAMRDYTAAQLLDTNRQKVAAMGLDRTTTEALFANRNYTPLDMTSMVTALEATPAEGRADFLRRAAGVTKREAAYFNRRYTEMVADYHAKTGAVVSFVSLGEFPFNRVRSGGVVGIWPVDALSWTNGTRNAMGNAAAAIRSRNLGRAELRITGQATARAKQGLKELGFALAENLRP